MKRSAPRKNPAKPTRPGPKHGVDGASAPATPEAMPRGRRPYSTDVTSAESNAEFLRSMGDIFYDRANEVERAAAKEKGTK